jgi:hypothetical protein
MIDVNDSPISLLLARFENDLREPMEAENVKEQIGM